MNTKGHFGNIILIGVILLIIAVTVPIAYIIVQNFQANSAGIITDPTAQAILTQGGNSFAAWDYAFLFLLAGTLVGLIISATQIKTSPVFFFVFLFGLALEFFLAPIFSNIYEGITGTSAINSSINMATRYPIMNFIMLRLPFFMAFGLIIFLIVMFAKPSGENGGY